jgi:hypothetical protein
VSVMPKASTKARNRAMSGDMEQALMEEIAIQQSDTVKTVVPWFLNEMPNSYFKQIREELQRSHIKAMAALHDLGVKSDLSMQIITKSDSATEVTYINTQISRGSLIANVSYYFNLPSVI